MDAGALPGGAAEWAVVAAMFILVARELADFTEGNAMEIVAVAVEAIFGEVFVVFDAVFGAEFFGLSPGFGLDFEEFDIRVVICFAEEIVAELVEKEKLSSGAGIICFGGIKKRGGRGKLEAFAGLDLQIGEIFSQF